MVSAVDSTARFTLVVALTFEARAICRARQQRLAGPATLQFLLVDRDARRELTHGRNVIDDMEQDELAALRSSESDGLAQSSPGSVAAVEGNEDSVVHGGRGSGVGSLFDLDG
jgi:hypothetical protein